MKEQIQVYFLFLLDFLTLHKLSTILSASLQIVSFTTFTTGVDILFGFVLGADCFLREILLAGGKSTSLILLFLFTGSGDTIAIAAIGEDADVATNAALDDGGVVEELGDDVEDDM